MTEATGSHVSAAAATTTNKALLEAQKRLRISQQQVGRILPQSMHAFAAQSRILHVECNNEFCVSSIYQAVWALNHLSLQI